MMIQTPAASAPAVPGGNDDKLPWEYSLRKYLLLLATLVATVTYSAGFSPPGGVWQETDDHHLAGDSILRETSKARYVVFFYLNAGAFASSLVVIVLILILSVRHELTRSDRRRWLAPLNVLRGFMVLDLLTLIGAYTAGIFRERDVPVYTMILAALTVVYLVVFVLPSKKQQYDDATSLGNSEEAIKTPDELRKERERPRKVLMLLATFAVSVTYLAGLNAPGGFWNDAEGHHPGEPILMGGSHETRLKVFVNLNSTAFVWSLFITVQLLDRNLHLHDQKGQFRFPLLFVSIVVALLGLVGAYVAGSCRETDATIYVAVLGAALPACTILLLRLINGCCPGKQQEQDEATTTTTDGGINNNRNNNRGDEGNKNSSSGQEHDEATTAINNTSNNTAGEEDEEKAKEARSLVLLLATLAATITYQAGLNPPGGLWDNDVRYHGYNYLAGDPILRTMNPRRYNAFFYCNSVAFVASLLAIILVKKRMFLKTHALQVAMILDLFGLIGAYAAGSCREVSTSIYAMALAGAVLVYVVIHVLFLTLDQDTRRRNNNIEVEKKELEVVEKRRKRLLLFAILTATITYQAGLTPPGGFRVKLGDLSGGSGHRAGDPVLLYNSQSRYNAFFYCNSVSFMLSMAMILLLVNKNLYKPAIQSHAISVCTAAGMLGLVGAYAAGSTQYMKTSIKIFGLVAAILLVLLAVVLIFVACSKKPANAPCLGEDANANSTKDKKKQQEHAERRYLMLLGILVASVTYQAGLTPPGGMWQDNDGHVAGNSVMHDNGKARYLSFFYINSTSFVASIIVIILLLLEFLKKEVSSGPSSRRTTSSMWELIKPMNTMIVLADLLGLLVAYAVGSSRSWEATGHVFMLVFLVLAYIVIHVTLSHIVRSGFSSLKAIIEDCFFWVKKNNVPTAPDPESNEQRVNGVTGH